MMMLSAWAVAHPTLFMGGALLLSLGILVVMGVAFWRSWTDTTLALRNGKAREEALDEWRRTHQEPPSTELLLRSRVPLQIVRDEDEAATSAAGER